MTQTAIKTQVDAINKATAIASQSKESAMKFLVNAGIVKEEKTKLTSQAKAKK